MIKWNLNARTEYYCLFSKSGFSKRFHDVAEYENILPFTLDDYENEGKTDAIQTCY
jgi:hypothetical protein